MTNEHPYTPPTPRESDRCERKCRDCGNVAFHDAPWTPYVLCGKCGSQDTRLVVDHVAAKVSDKPDSGEQVSDNPPRCASCGVPYVRHLGLQGTCKALLEAKAEVERLQKEISDIAGFARTCRLNNTKDWMRMLAERLNNAAKAIGVEKDFYSPGACIYSRKEQLEQ